MAKRDLSRAFFILDKLQLIMYHQSSSMEQTKLASMVKVELVFFLMSVQSERAIGPDWDILKMCYTQL